MGKRQRDWARRARLELIQELGGKCVDCLTIDELEIDHITPCGWDHNSVDQSARISRYRREAKEGKLTVRCHRCNVSKGDRNDPNGVNGRMPEMETPF